MTTDKLAQDDIEAMFSAARETSPVPSAQLLERVMADAATVQAALQSTTQPALPKRGLIARWFESLGGWPAVTGMATATVAGVWIGYVQPDNLTNLTNLILPQTDAGYTLDDFAPSSYAYLLEGDV